MSHPTTRLLTLLELLQSHSRISGADLARRLGVDPRTVRRYATRLAELGIPVEAERGRHGGYRLLPGYRLPPLMSTDDEAVTVALGLVAGARSGLAPDGASVESALSKLHRVMPVTLRDRIRAVTETLEFTGAPRPGHSPDSDILLTLGEAVRLRRRVEVLLETTLEQAARRIPAIPGRRPPDADTGPVVPLRTASPAASTTGTRDLRLEERRVLILSDLSDSPGPSSAASGGVSRQTDAERGAEPEG